MGIKPGSDMELDKLSSQQLIQVQFEFQNGLAQIASLCSQLIGLELTPEEVQSRKSVMEVLEEMRSEIETLKTQFREREDYENQKYKNRIQKSNTNLHRAAGRRVSEDEKEEQLLGEIVAKTADEEEAWLESQVENIKLRSRQVVDGTSMKGKSVKEISKGIPLAADCKTTATIQITNYLDESLTSPQFDFARATSFGDVPKIIVGCTTEVVCFQGDSKFASGLCSYRIGTSDLRLTIKFASGFNGEILLGLAFTPQNVPVNARLYSFNDGKPERPDVKFMYDQDLCSEPIEWIVQHKHLLAKATMRVGPKATIEVAIMRICFQASPEDYMGKSLEALDIVNGESFKESLLYNGIASVITDKLGCAVEITNLLNVSLQKPTRYIQNCLHHNLLPSVVLPFTRETFYASDNGYVKGIFTYEIEKTDLQLAVVFQNLDREGNSYAIGLNSLTDEDMKCKEMLGVLVSSREWKTRPDRKYLEAGEDTIIQLRNVTATASMTKDPKSVLRIIVSAL